MELIVRRFRRWCGSLVAARLSVVCALWLAGCATVHPVAYEELDSARLLASNPGDDTGHVPLLYAAPGVSLAAYRGIIFEPVSVYAGPDQQFGKLPPEDREALADYMYAQFQKALGTRYTLSVEPGTSILRVHVTLAGVTKTIPVLGTVGQITPVGALVGTIRTARDKPSRTLGSVTYVVEAYDSVTNRLVRAFVVNEYPAAENIPASLGSLTAAQAGIRKGADLLVGELQ